MRTRAVVTAMAPECEETVAVRTGTRYHVTRKLLIEGVLHWFAKCTNVCKDMYSY